MATKFQKLLKKKAILFGSPFHKSLSLALFGFFIIHLIVLKLHLTNLN